MAPERPTCSARGPRRSSSSCSGSGCSRGSSARPRPGALYGVLPAGALGPILIVATLPAGGGFRLAAALEALAVIGYAVAFLVLFYRSEGRRVAFYGILTGAVSGVLAVSIGALLAVAGPDTALVAAHRRLALLGFLGLTIVGTSLQFYPPNVGRWPGCDDRTALAAISLLAAGVAGSISSVDQLGATLTLAGVLGYGYLLAGAFATR